MDRIIQRIAMALNANVPFSEIHDTIVNSSDEPCTEEDFFLAYHAAEILLGT